MSESQKAERAHEANTDKDSFDFKLENCLEYMNAGIEAIIEDDVTSRFEAEEIKNWNLLTRTNRRYEFITWRLTVIWVIGFFVRYFILMPIRVFICFCGVRSLIPISPLVVVTYLFLCPVVKLTLDHGILGELTRGSPGTRFFVDNVPCPFPIIIVTLFPIFPFSKSKSIQNM